MNLTHTTQDGRTMMIAEMEDSHLKNTVKMILKGVDVAKEVLNGRELDPFKKALYSDRTPVMSKNQAKGVIASSPEKLAPYIMECVVRGIDFSLELRVTFDRAPRKEEFNDIKLDNYMENPVLIHEKFNSYKSEKIEELKEDMPF